MGSMEMNDAGKTKQQLISELVEMRQAQDELKQAYNALALAQTSAINAEKMGAIGRLAAGVSHEILNPLNIIGLCLGRLLGDPDIDPDLAGDLEAVKKQANRITKIVQELISFSGRLRLERRQIDINEVIQQALSSLERDLGLVNISLGLSLAEVLPPVSADWGQLQQVVINLLANARDAMPDGGRLTLSTDTVREKGEERIEFRVEDTGPGIDPEHLDKLFEPFFTTKPVDKGKGLGLSFCQGIVEAHGGSIWAESEEGRGAVFIVQLPPGATPEQE